MVWLIFAFCFDEELDEDDDELEDEELDEEDLGFDDLFCEACCKFSSLEASLAIDAVSVLYL
jgi:hypothetical protein